MQGSARNKLFVMMILEIAIWGAWQPKIFNYMGLLGFVSWQQNLAGSVFGIAAIAGIFFSNEFADRNFAAEKFLAVSHVIGGFALVGAAFLTSFWGFFTAFLIYGLLYVPTISVTNSLAFANLQNPAKDFGFVRMGGTVGWIIVSFPLYFLLQNGATVESVRWIFLVAAILSFAMAAFSLTLPHTPPKTDVAKEDRIAWLRAARFLKSPFILTLFVVTFIDSVIQNGYFVVTNDYLTDLVGIAPKWTMIVMSLGQVAEIIAMLLLGKVLVKFGWKVTLIVGILGHAARFGIFAFFPHVAWLIVAIQLLHGICYAFFFAVVYIFVDEVFPKDVRASAQGLFNLLILGVGMVAASFFFVWLRAHLTTIVDGKPVVDYQALFLYPTGFALFAVLLLALFFRPPTRGPGAELAEGEAGAIL